jgi:hypothetical protein
MVVNPRVPSQLPLSLPRFGAPSNALAHRFYAVKRPRRRRPKVTDAALVSSRSPASQREESDADDHAIEYAAVVRASSSFPSLSLITRRPPEKDNSAAGAGKPHRR